MPCGWGVKAGMVRVWVAGKTVWSPCYTRAISEHFRDKELTIVLYKFAFFTLLFIIALTLNTDKIVLSVSQPDSQSVWLYLCMAVNSVLGKVV